MRKLGFHGHPFLSQCTDLKIIESTTNVFGAVPPALTTRSGTDDTTNDLVGLPIQYLAVAHLLPVVFCWCFVLSGLVTENDS
jgi:hypothetical protein